MDYIGVVISKEEDGTYTAQRVAIEGTEVMLEPIRYGAGRAKKSAVRIAKEELSAISQEIQRGQVDFDGLGWEIEDEEDEDELA